MDPSDFSRLIEVGDPTLSPDGQTVAFVVTRVDGPAGTYRSAIWLAATDGSTPPTQFSAGTERDGGPTWSPNGRRLAFTRSVAAPGAGSGGSGGADSPKHWLLMAPVDGPGELVTLGQHADEGFGHLAWSPDGRYLAYVQRVRDQRYSPDHERLRPPRRIDSMANRLDSVGWITDRHSHVFVVPVDGTATPRQVTDGPYEHDAPAWSPDSTRLVCSAGRHENGDLDPAIDLWVFDLPAAGRGDDDPAPAPTCLTETVQAWYAPSWSPDGTRVAAVVTDYHSIHRHAQVGVVDVASQSSTVLTTALDRNCAPLPGLRPPLWVGDDALLFATEDHGRVPVLRIATDGASPADVLLDGDRWVTAYDATTDAASLVFCASTTTRPNELFAVAPAGSGGSNGSDESTGSTGERQLTTLQDSFLAACPAHPAERFGVPSPAGDGDIDAWIMRPPGWSSSGRFPMLLQVHGGPMTQHGERWFDEAQLYASAGYVVVYANPHGSTGSTEQWARAIRSPLAEEDPGTGWGGIDYEDLMAVVDAALAREPSIDADRLGLLGGSYGGYMTSWAVGHTDRFAAGCSERAVNNLLTLEWTSDIAGLFRFELGVDPLDDADEYMRMSPVTYVRDIRTPLLILHSEEDLRCHVEQADQLFGRLRLLGRDVEYWRFPAESHELSRSGSPAHRQQRVEIILDWFARWLKPS